MGLAGLAGCIERALEVLLLGEANFSFALALTAALRWRGAVPDVLETATGAQRAAADAYLGLRPECRRPLHTLGAQT